MLSETKPTGSGEEVQKQEVSKVNVLINVVGVMPLNVSFGREKSIANEDQILVDAEQVKGCKEAEDNKISLQFGGEKQRQNGEGQAPWVKLQSNRDALPGSSFRRLLPSPNQYPPNEQQHLTPQFQTGKVSKRRICPTEPFLLQQEKLIEDKFATVDTHFTDCGTYFERKNRRNGVREQPAVNEGCLWVYHEYFYANHDRMYFHQEDEAFRRILAELGLNPDHTTYGDYRMVHRVLPAPRLFCPDFIYAEQTRLADFRISARIHSKSRIKNEDFELAVAREVFAVHPICGHIHSGSILAYYKDTSYMVKFTRAELGTQKVSDLHIYTKENSTANGCIVDKIDHESMALAIELIRYKSDLIEKFKEYNNLALQMKQKDINFDNEFLQEYGWIGTTIKILSLGMRHIISRFRIRGLSDNKSNEKIGTNYGTVLIHPLVAINKGLIRSVQAVDQKASNQINAMVGWQRQRKAKQLLQNYTSKWTAQLQSSALPAEQSSQIAALVQACINIFVALEYEPKSLHLHQNASLKQIINIVDMKSPEHVNQIYDRVNCVLTKANDNK